MRHLAFTTAVLLGLAALPPAHADVLLANGQFSAVAPGTLTGLADDAGADALPLRRLGGPNSHLVDPIFQSYEPVADELYVSDFRGQTIRVYPVGANGDATPRRELSALGTQVRAAIADYGLDTLVAIVGNCCIATWPRTASGSAAATRLITSLGANNVTQLNNPVSLALSPALDELIVGDSDKAAPFAPKVLFFDRLANGNVAPKRVLQGELTRLERVSYLALDATQGDLYVAAASGSGGTTSARILVFKAFDGGNVPPVRTIEGALTGLELNGGDSVRGLAVDAASGRLLVTVAGGASGRARVLVFDLGAGGNVPPQAVLGGNDAGLGAVGAALAVPDRILRTGFDAMP